MSLFIVKSCNLGNIRISKSMEKWLRRTKIAQGHAILLKKRERKTVFLVLRCPLCDGSLTSSDYISGIVECSMILLWGVKSRSSVQTDAERGSRWALSHSAGCFHHASESLNGSLIPGAVREYGCSWLSHNCSVLYLTHSCRLERSGSVEKNHPHTLTHKSITHL